MPSAGRARNAPGRQPVLFRRRLVLRRDQRTRQHAGDGLRPRDAVLDQILLGPPELGVAFRIGDPQLFGLTRHFDIAAQLVAETPDQVGFKAQTRRAIHHPVLAVELLKLVFREHVCDYSRCLKPAGAPAFREDAGLIRRHLKLYGLRARPNGVQGKPYTLFLFDNHRLLSGRAKISRPGVGKLGAIISPLKSALRASPLRWASEAVLGDLSQRSLDD